MVCVMQKEVGPENMLNDKRGNAETTELVGNNGHVELDAESKELRRSQRKRITNFAMRDYVW